MREIKDCNVFEGKIPKLSKVNSFIASGRDIYICKKDYIGKTIKGFIAYDVATKIQLMFYWDKELLIKFIQGKSLTSLGGDIQGNLF